MPTKKRKRKRTLSQASPMQLSRGRKKVRRRKRRRKGLSGLVGGAISNMLNRFEMTGITRAAVNLGASFITGVYLDAPNVGAGMAGGYGLLLSQELAANKGTISEDSGNAEYADQDILERYPMFADASGTPMYLEEDGNLYYLEEGGENEDMNLEEGEDNLYPTYVNAANY